MPLPARVRAQRRLERKKLEPAKLFKRKRCINCDSLFPLTKENRKFCCDNCRKEFHANGGNAFGPLKIRLEKLVNKQVGKLAAHIRALEGDVAELRREILRGREAPPA